eukprot:TRINITY_DN4433_c6_g1_i1.p1 TRINITY_DN4433_c6_g1~~TRINITY_DN4433_c6_g1_i1.p1  ORF type:complete len:328 (+),score=91.01 TRINITY_DN4433_c6_g1_i1:58-1041(+)
MSRMGRRMMSFGAGGLLATGCGIYAISAKEKRSYMVYAAPGMEEMALKLVRSEPGVHRYMPIQWGKNEDGSDNVNVQGIQNGEVLNENVLFLAALTDNESVLMQYHAMSALCGAVVNSMTVVAPYMPGTSSGDASNTAQLLSSLPNCGTPHRIISYDTVMSCGSGAKADVKSVAPVIASLMKEKKFNCIAFPSSEASGVYKEALHLAGSKHSVVRCDRKSDEIIAAKTTVEVLEGSPKGMHVLLVDTVLQKNNKNLSEVSEALLNKGALSVSVFCTHALPTHDWAAYNDSTISKVYVSNSHSATKTSIPKSPKFEVVDMHQVVFKDI